MLIAFVMDEKAIPRHGMPIAGGGEVTSGTHSPMLERGIGMGYVPSAHASPGTELQIDVRGKPRRAHVVRKPIYTKETR
jgi:aminomethyltransferase